MKRVLLTGASGFIGRQAISPLLAQGYEVYTVSRHPNDHKLQGVKHTLCNLLDPSQTSQLIETIKPSHLLHFAWYVLPGKCWTASENLDWVAASLHLLQQFVKHGGKRVVMAGSCAEYDWVQGDGICRENQTLLNPSTLYGTCKHALYQIVEAYARQNKLSWAWGRIFHLYGPYEYPSRLVSYVIQNLLRKEFARCSQGNQVRDFLHVADVAEAFVALLESEVQGAINIASGQAITIKEVIDQIANKLNAKNLVQYGMLSTPNDPPIILADVNKLFNDLSWQPRQSLENGLEATIAWWKNNYNPEFKPDNDAEKQFNLNKLSDGNRLKSETANNVKVNF